MITFKHFLQLEARKNAQVNTKQSINDLLYDYYSKSPSLFAEKKNAFVSFTTVPKLGINPQSIYGTPIGIYAYPINYVLMVIGKNASMADMEFAGDAPYANAFNANGNILDIKNMNSKQFKTYMEKVLQYWQSKDSSLEDDYLDSFVYNNYRGDEYAGPQFWKLTHRIADSISKKTSTSTPVAWNQLFIAIGIDGIVDYGSGIVHPNEPTQAVFFHIKAVKNVKLFNNKYSPVHVSTGTKPLQRQKYDDIYNENDEEDDDDWMTQELPDHSKKELIPRHSGVKIPETSPKKNETEKQFNTRVLKYLKNHPEEYKKVKSNSSLDLAFVKADAMNIKYYEEVHGKSEQMVLAAISVFPHAIFYAKYPSLEARVMALKKAPHLESYFVNDGDYEALETAFPEKYKKKK